MFTHRAPLLYIITGILFLGAAGLTALGQAHDLSQAALWLAIGLFFLLLGSSKLRKTL